MGAQLNAAPVVIIKRKKIIKVSGHHGGAWKVAYADFVTAMMAFFMLMWLLNATTETQKKGLRITFLRRFQSVEFLVGVTVPLVVIVFFRKTRCLRSVRVQHRCDPLSRTKPAVTWEHLTQTVKTQCPKIYSLNH